MIGVLSLELFPSRPLAALLAVGGASLLPVDFQRLSLSAGAEVDFWFFALTASIFWIHYAKTNKAVFLFLNALSLWLLSMTRYEGWCFLASHSLFCYLLFRVDPRRPRHLFPAYLGLAWSYVVFFIIYQEMTLPSPDIAIYRSPLSYVAIRIPPSSIHPSMAHDPLTPLRLFFQFPGNPWRKALAFMELAGVASILLRGRWLGPAAAATRRGDGPPVPEWHALMVLTQFAAYILISGVFGMPQNIRVILVMHVLLLPYLGSLAARLAPPRQEALATAAAAALSLLAVFDSIKRLHAPFQNGRDSSVMSPIARALYLSERGMSRKPRILVELGTGGRSFDCVPIDFLSLDTPDRVLYDRSPLYNLAVGCLMTEDNPTVFDGPPARLLDSLRKNKIGLVIAHSDAAKRRLRRIAVFLLSDGDWSVFGYDLPPALVRTYRSHVP